MKLKHLKLTHFRCFDALDVEFDPKLTVIVGNNGSGKTAILDGVARGLNRVLRRLKVPSHDLLDGLDKP